MKNRKQTHICGIIDKNTPSLEELLEYNMSDETYNSESYKALATQIDNLLKNGHRHFAITTTPKSLMAGEYISQQKKKHIKYKFIKLDILIPQGGFLPCFAFDLTKYPNLLKGYTEISILSNKPTKFPLSNAVNLLRNQSHSILEI